MNRLTRTDFDSISGLLGWLMSFEGSLTLTPTGLRDENERPKTEPKKLRLIVELTFTQPSHIY